MNRMVLTWLCLLLAVAAPWALAQSESLTTLRADREAAEARDEARLSALVEDRDALEQALEEAREARDEAAQRRDELEARRAELDTREAAIEARMGEQGEELASLLSTLQRHSGELRDALAESWLTVGGVMLPPRIDDADVLTLEHIEGLADSLMALTIETGRAVVLEAPVAGADGEVSRRPLVRLGDVAAFSEGQLLHRGVDDDTLSVASHTPSAVTEVLSAFQAGRGESLVLDPTRGTLLAALAQQPTLRERFHQGGVVGYVVVGLGTLGLLVALAQYAYLLWVTLAVRRQRRSLGHLQDDNPLGRVLVRFLALDEGHAPEALEARLDEAMLAEQPRLERGQALVKLIAALAPLLGLLGTVTGMIVTFQSITVFGTGDPQLMAGGISQALVTTVLGLVTAVPLLFAHTALVSRSRQLIGIVEGQASAALADHLEARLSRVAERRGMLPLWLESLERLAEAGGPVLLGIALVAMLLFALALERVWFFHVGHRRARHRLIERWVARTDHLSWSARTLREVWTRELIDRLRRPMPWMKLLVALCPLLGLLGTVTGMIAVFDGLGASETSQARALAQGVARATLPTLSGMAVAVVGLMFTSRLEQVIRREDQRLHDRLARALEEPHA